ncbi:hypothetical protein ALI22I_01435 [Saccharothrix sp. ALI-22-I]|uniref:hypothetical protein n=1 Tax=Saccharothrix sp. ALI-22-I TaxID=1933778 RepID=UPI00097BDB2F|nr:hypothetical protein [Saccharothrix sp. ALI-22-I]ONI92867.1 hypothetical protein ALI22I_01435 [Saccharothrix sp. ALI-22-I]
MSPLVFPVGHYAGERHPEGTHGVRVGRDVHELTEDEFGVWVLSHGSGRVGRGAWTAADAVSLAEEAGLADPTGAVERLAAAGVLALVGEGDVPGFAGRYRLEALLVGSGNTAADPDRHGVGIPGLPPVAVLDTGSHELWQWGPVAPSLWHVHAARAEVAVRLDEPRGGDELWEDLVGDLRVLLINSCAYLDVVRRA